MITSDESEMMWMEAIVAYFKVLSQHVPGQITENHEQFSQNIQSLG
jgi:hypothetical protein